MITVANVKWGQPGIYIGRAVRCWPGSPLGNPFPITGTCNRAEVIERYRAWLEGRVAAGDEAIIHEIVRIKDLSRQRDIRLLCWCRPKPCHGDVLKEILESME